MFSVGNLQLSVEISNFLPHVLLTHKAAGTEPRKDMSIFVRLVGR